MLGQGLLGGSHDVRFVAKGLLNITFAAPKTYPPTNEHGSAKRPTNQEKSRRSTGGLCTSPC